MKVLSFIKMKRVHSYFSKKLKETWEYCGFFDLVSSIYIYVAFSVFLQFYCFDFEDSMCFLNYSLHSFFSLFVFVFPIMMGIFIHKQDNLKENSDIQVRFNSIFGGLKLFNDNEEVILIEMECQKVDFMKRKILFARRTA